MDQANASGGVNGHPLQLITENDSSVPSNSLTAAQTLISDHVDVIVDNTVLDSTWESTVATAKIPVICISPNDDCSSNPDFYSTGQTENSSTTAVAVTAKATGASRFGILYCAESPSCQTLVPLVRSAGEKLGMSLTYSGAISATAPSYTAQCVAAAQAHVQALLVFDVSAIVAKVGSNCSQQGYDPTYVTEGAGFGAVEFVTPGIDKDLWSEYNVLPYWDSSPAVQAMNAAVDKYYPGLRSNIEVWAQGAALGWAAGLLLRDAIKGGVNSPSATPSAAALTTGLESLHGDTLDGWSPPLTFPAGQDHPIDCWFIGRITNGKGSMVNNGKVSCEASS